ncbi:MAG: phosphatidylserine decarboxylase [Acutalibacteraceae bacterium]
MIKSFIKNNSIDMSQYENKNFSCYNDFFTRKIKLENRPMSDNKKELISPADSRLLVFDIDEKLKFKIKNGYYDLTSFLNDEDLSKEFSGGKLLVFRLCVDDYHRYCFIDNGEIVSNKFIKGKLHTVQPIALEKDDFFKENCREVTVINSENFGKTVMVEVGAMMVGKIVNHNTNGFVQKGEEKGYFEFGGSTVCVILKKDAVNIDSEITENSKKNLETRVLFRETIGTK